MLCERNLYVTKLHWRSNEASCLEAHTWVQRTEPTWEDDCDALVSCAFIFTLEILPRWVLWQRTTYEMFTIPMSPVEQPGSGFGNTSCRSERGYCWMLFMSITFVASISVYLPPRRILRSFRSSDLNTSSSTNGRDATSYKLAKHDFHLGLTAKMDMRLK